MYKNKKNMQCNCDGRAILGLYSRDKAKEGRRIRSEAPYKGRNSHVTYPSRVRSSQQLNY